MSSKDLILDLLAQSARCCEDDSQQGIRLARKAVALALATEDEALGTQAEISLARSLLYNGRFHEALDGAIHASSNCQRLPLGTQIEAQDLLGHIYDRLGDYQNSLEARIQQLKLVEQQDNVLGVADVVSSIGVAYARMEDHAKSLENYLKAYELKSANNADQESIARTLNNIGLAHRNLGNIGKALDAHQRSMDMFSASGQKFLTAAAMGNLARAQEASGDQESATSSFAQALEIMRDSDNCYFLSEILRDYGELEFHMGNNEHAKTLFEEALELAYRTEAKPDIFKTHRLLVDIYESLGESGTALHHMRRCHAVEKEVFNTESETRVQRMRILHELERTEQEKEIYRLKNIELADALKETRRLQHELERQTREDQLTGLFNRRHLTETMKLEFERAKRHRTPLSLVLCDIDHFKQVNDSFSHAVGDAVLQEIARILRSHIRKGDLAARYGGEEFVLVLPQTPGESARVFCEHMRLAIEGFDWQSLKPGLRVTMSFGISNLMLSHSDPEGLLHDADLQLYDAKRGGRNQVCYCEG